MIFFKLFYVFSKIGIFNFGGGYAMLSLIQNETVVKNHWLTNAEFTDIGGLKARAPVKASGVLVGRVESIALDPQSYRAKVAIRLDDQYKFSSDVSAQILTSGLLGEQYIGLMQGGDPENLAAGDTITLTNSALVLENLIGKFMTNFAEGNSRPSEKQDAPQP